LPRTNQDVIRIVKKWQAAGIVHELTCRIDSRHAPLMPIESLGKVVLACPTCGTAQEHIPEFVLDSEPSLDAMTQRLEAANQALARHAEITRTLWTYTAATLSLGLVAGLAFGPAASLIGVAVGTVIAYAANRNRTRAP